MRFVDSGLRPIEFILMKDPESTFKLLYQDSGNRKIINYG